MKIVGIFDCLSVDEDLLVDDFECFAGQGDAAFDEVFALVNGSCDDFAEDVGVLVNGIAAVFADEVVVGAVALEGGADGVAIGIVEDCGVEPFDFTQSGVAVIWQADPFEIGFGLAVGEG